MTASDASAGSTRNPAQAARKVAGEAFTAAWAGQPLSFEIHLWGADRVVLTGRHYWQSLHRDGDCNPCGVVDPGMRGHFWRGNREISDVC